MKTHKEIINYMEFALEQLSDWETLSPDHRKVYAYRIAKAAEELAKLAEEDGKP